MSEIERGNVAQAFEDIIKGLTQSDLDKLAGALDALEEAEPKVYTALQGHALMHDIINAISEERMFRARFLKRPDHEMSELGKAVFDLGNTLIRAIQDAKKVNP